MIVVGSLAPDARLEPLLASAAEAERAVAAEARKEQEREWTLDLGPAVFATYTQAAVNAANRVSLVAKKIAADHSLAPLLVRDVRQTFERERQSVAALDASIRDYAARAPWPALQAAARRMAEVSAMIVQTWDRIAANAAAIEADLATDQREAVIDRLSLASSYERWKDLAEKVEALQSGRTAS
jgi:hypothetical protein